MRDGLGLRVPGHFSQRSEGPIPHMSIIPPPPHARARHLSGLSDRHQIREDSSSLLCWCHKNPWGLQTPAGVGVGGDAGTNTSSGPHRFSVPVSQRGAQGPGASIWGVASPKGSFISSQMFTSLPPVPNMAVGTAATAANTATDHMEFCCINRLRSNKEDSP